MKVVIDANIIISGLRFGGVQRQILEAVNKGDHVGFTSSAAMEEVETVLLEKFKILPSECILTVDVLRDSFVVVPTPILPDVPELRDKRDLHILAVADLSSAEFIITGDKDLLVLGQYSDIPIIRASDFVDLPF